MSTHVIAAIDNLTTAIQTTFSGITQSIDSNTSALLQINSKLDSLLNQKQLSQDCCPQLIYDCSTGEYTWIYEQKTPPVSSVIISDTYDDYTDGDGDIDRYEGDPIADDRGIGYGDPATTPPDQSASWNDFDVGMCRKANWFVDSAVLVFEDIYNGIGNLGVFGVSLTDAAGIVTEIINMRMITASAEGFWIGAVKVIGEQGIKFFKVPFTLIMLVAGIAVNKLFDWTASVALQQIEDARDDLICAIYNGKSPAGIKANWNAAINKNWQVWSPVAVILKSLLYENLAKGLVYGNAADLPKPYRSTTYDCGGCGEDTTNTTLVWWWANGNKLWYQKHYYIWPTGGYATNNVGDWFSSDKINHNVNGFINVPTGATWRVTNIGTINVRLLSNTNGSGWSYNVLLTPGQSTNVVGAKNGLNITTDNANPGKVVVEVL